MKIAGHTPCSIQSHDDITSLPTLDPWLGREPEMLKDLTQESREKKRDGLNSLQTLVMDLVLEMEQGGHDQLRRAKPKSLLNPV